MGKVKVEYVEKNTPPKSLSYADLRGEGRLYKCVSDRDGDFVGAIVARPDGYNDNKVFLVFNPYSGVDAAETFEYTTVLPDTRYVELKNVEVTIKATA